MSVKQGALGPAEVLDVRLDSTRVDLTTVTSVELSITRKGGGSSVWIPAINTDDFPAPTATRMWVTYVFNSSVSDVPDVGTFRVYVTYLVGATRIRGGYFDLLVERY